MNSKKVRILRKLYHGNPSLMDFMTFKQYKKVYLKDVAKGSKTLKLIQEREQNGIS